MIKYSAGLTDVVLDEMRGRVAEFWARRLTDLWPIDTDQYLFLGNAILALGKREFADWCGDEPWMAMMPVLDGSRPMARDGFDAVFAAWTLKQFEPEMAMRFDGNWGPVNAPLSPIEWEAAFAAFKSHLSRNRTAALTKTRRIYRLLSEALAKGELLASVRTKAGFEAVPPEHWMDEGVNEYRYLECQMNPLEHTAYPVPSDLSALFHLIDGFPLLPGNGWIFLSTDSFNNLLGQGKRNAIKTSGRHPSRPALEKYYRGFIAGKPAANRQQWVESAQAETGCSASAAREIWKEHTPPGGRKSGPKGPRNSAG